MRGVNGKNINYLSVMAKKLIVSCVGQPVGATFKNSSLIVTGRHPPTRRYPLIRAGPCKTAITLSCTGYTAKLPSVLSGVKIPQASLAAMEQTNERLRPQIPFL